MHFLISNRERIRKRQVSVQTFPSKERRRGRGKRGVEELSVINSVRHVYVWTGVEALVRAKTLLKTADAVAALTLEVIHLSPRRALHRRTPSHTLTSCPTPSHTPHAFSRIVSPNVSIYLFDFESSTILSLSFSLSLSLYYIYRFSSLFSLSSLCIRSCTDPLRPTCHAYTRLGLMTGRSWLPSVCLLSSPPLFSPPSLLP